MNFREQCDAQPWSTEMRPSRRQLIGLHKMVSPRVCYVLPMRPQCAATTKPKAKPDFHFNIPFVSDRFNRHIKSLLDKHNISAHVVNRRGRTLHEFASTRPTKAASGCPGKKPCAALGCCRKSSVVYKAPLFTLREFLRWYDYQTPPRQSSRTSPHSPASH